MIMSCDVGIAIEEVSDYTMPSRICKWIIKESTRFQFILSFFSRLIVCCLLVFLVFFFSVIVNWDQSRCNRVLLNTSWITHIQIHRFTCFLCLIIFCFFNLILELFHIFAKTISKQYEIECSTRNTMVQYTTNTQAKTIVDNTNFMQELWCQIKMYAILIKIHNFTNLIFIKKTAQGKILRMGINIKCLIINMLDLYVIQFESDLWWFSPDTPVSPPIKLTVTT
jgi:hypothetical protein